MNYKKIIFKGYSDENNRKFLPEYFIRKLNKDKTKKQIEDAEFFNGLSIVMQRLESDLDKKLFARKMELELMIKLAENKDFNSHPSAPNHYTLEEKKQFSINVFKNDLNEISRDDFDITVFEDENFINLNNYDLIEIKTALFIAQKKLEHETMLTDFENLKNKSLPTKAEILKERLTPYGFMKLEVVKILSSENLNKLFDFIASNKVPFQIAILSYLGFVKHLESNYFSNKTSLNKQLADILNTNSRNIKGNLSVLNPCSKEDRSRYTSYLYKEKSKIFYQNLK